MVEGIVVVSYSALEGKGAGIGEQDIILDKAGQAGDAERIGGFGDVADSGNAGLIGKGIAG